MGAQEAANTMRSLHRAIDVLEALEDAPRGMRLAEVASTVGLSAPTTLRILSALETRGRVEHDGPLYRAGVGLLFGAHAYLGSSPLVLASRGVLQDLAVSTTLTASVFVRSRSDRVVIARVEGSNPLQYHLPIGDRLPLHLGAGKVLVAHMEQAERDTFVEEVCPFETAGGRLIEAPEYLEIVEAVRREGLACSESERVLHGRSLAVPIRSSSGAVVGAIQVAGTTSSLSEQAWDQAAAAVRSAAQHLGVLV